MSRPPAHPPNTTKPDRCSAPALIRLLALAAALCGAVSAHADAYGDVNQLLKTGKGADALQAANKYLAEKPKDPQMRFLKGVIQSQAGSTADAIATFQALTQDYPELPEPYNNLAALYASQNELDKARTALEMAVRMNPSYAIAHENLGDIYARMAGLSYGRALQLEPANPLLQPKINLLRELPTAGAKGKPAAKK